MHLLYQILPGRLATVISNNTELVSRAYPKNEFFFVCKNCGKRGKYDVGHITINLESYSKDKRNDVTEYFQTVGYFRCKHCNSAGNRGITEDFRMGLKGALLGVHAGVEDTLVSVATNQLFDGSTHQYATDAEEQLLHKILSEPESSLLWNRLGNLYYKGGRPELAAVAFEHSISIDALQTESYYSLGMILQKIDSEKATEYYRKMLATACHYKEMEVNAFRQLIAVTILNLILMHSSSDNTFGSNEIFPSKEIYQELGIVLEEPHNPYGDLHGGEINLDELESFYPLAEVFMGDRRRDLPKDKRSGNRSRAK